MTRARLIGLTVLAGVLSLAPAATDWRAVLPVGERLADARTDPGAHARDRRSAEIQARFAQAVVMLHAREYDHAVAALHRVLELAPSMPEAYVNMGYALLGLKRPRAARDFFTGAVELRPGQANAYYGLALAAEAERDFPAALGAMRAYLHLSRADDPYRTKARSALWEWEEGLGRHGEAGDERPIPTAVPASVAGNAR